MSDDPTKPILLVKKKDAKKGSLWNTLTNRRIIKQHGGFDIPENDLHAIPKYHSPVEETAASPEETKEALADLEKEIQHLKQKDNRTPLSHQTSHEVKDPYDGEPLQHYENQGDIDD